MQHIQNLTNILESAKSVWNNYIMAQSHTNSLQPDFGVMQCSSFAVIDSDVNSTGFVSESIAIFLILLFQLLIIY